MLRARAIAFALFYGLAPSWLYEKDCHYDCGYLQHLAMNLAMAGRWLSFRETFEDVEFERKHKTPLSPAASTQPFSLDLPFLRRVLNCLTGRQHG